MRFPSFPLLVNTFLIAAIIAGIAFSAYKLSMTLHNFDTVTVSIDPTIPTESKNKLDEVLLKNIASFKHIRSFDHLFQTPPSDYRLNTAWINRCEVRQSDFYKFIKWQQRHPEADIAAPDQPADWKYRSTSAQHKVSGRLQAPANGISYYDAYAYCKASGGRLPQRLEWIGIAGGKQQRLYPWGDIFTSDSWPYLDSRLNASQACGLHASTDTPTGIHNLGDVVSEWAARDNDADRPSLHGGNAYNKPFEIYSLTAFYRYAPPTYRSPYVGFRCMYDSKPNQLPWGDTPPKTYRITTENVRVGLHEEARIPSLLRHLSGKKIAVIESLFNQTQQKTDFRILRHEVTRAQYRKFLNDPLVQVGLYANEKEPKGHQHQPLDWIDTPDDRDMLPVTNISWWSAWAFANWAGGQLPSAEEWMLASSNNARNVYPWGNDPGDGHAITAESGYTEPQKSMPDNKDKTANGIYNMGGNISEWTRTIVAADDHYVALVKGGNYALPSKDAARVDFENRVPLSLRSPRIGFRIVFDM